MKKLVFITSLLLIVCLISHAQQFTFVKENLSISSTTVSDSLRTISLDSLLVRNPKNTTKLDGVTPLTQGLWNTALADIESNIVKTDRGTYFGAGHKFGSRVYTRDISYSGILGANELYPDVMLQSLKVTRDVRLDMGYRVGRGYVVKEVDIDWVEEPLTTREFVTKYNTNSYVRRTDDVVWLWAAMDLFERHPEVADWEWLYTMGNQFFEKFYRPFWDESDQLYRGQASFVDIHFDNRKASGYPHEFSMTDCVLIKALSTNCLYLQGLRAMSQASEQMNKPEEAKRWRTEAETLRQAIRDHLRFEDGSFSYFKYPNGRLEPRREALGTALAVICGVVEGEDAIKALANYPVTWRGVPIFSPFYPWEKSYHNNASWPFVDTFFLWAREIAEGQDYTGMNAALLARTCIGQGSFHEVVNWQTAEPRGPSQLWSASAFVNVCLRAGVLKGKSQKSQ